MDKRLELTKDMLDSIKRLNEECLSRVKYEGHLINIIEQQNNTIDSYINNLNDKDKELECLKEEFEKLKNEACSFREQVEKMFLKEREMFYWENGILKVMDTTY